MSDSQTKLLRRIARAVEVRSVGPIDSPPGRQTVFANVVKAPDGALWYRWDPQKSQPIAFPKPAIRGRLTGCWAYEKESEKGTSTKIRIALSAGLSTYEIETSIHGQNGVVTSGKMLLAGLLEAEKAIKAEEMVTVEVQEAEREDAKDQVLFMYCYTDDGRLFYESSPQSKEEAITGVKAIRNWLGDDPDRYSERFQSRNGGQRCPSESEPSSRADQQPPPHGETPDGDDSARGDEDLKDMPPGYPYVPDSPPEPVAGTEHGQIDEDTALKLWNAAKIGGGYSRTKFTSMLSQAFGVDNPKFVHVDDWERAWRYACDPETWEEEEEAFSPDDELPF